MLRRSEEADVISAWNAHPETISWVASEGMMTYITTGREGADLGFASAGLCTLPLLQAFLPSLRTFRAKSEPTDPGCWRRVKAGKVPWTVLAINRKIFLNKSGFPSLHEKKQKAFLQMNPG